MNEQKNYETLSVLIIDNIDECSILEKYIKDLGYRVVAVESYSDALKKVKKIDFDLIVMDMNLSGDDWINIVFKIREIVGEANIVMMSDSNTLDIELSVREQRVMYYIVKPLELCEIKSIMEYLSQKKLSKAV